MHLQFVILSEEALVERSHIDLDTSVLNVAKVTLPVTMDYVFKILIQTFVSWTLGLGFSKHSSF